MTLEHELCRALTRVDAPDGFTERVLAHVDRTRRAARSSRPQHRRRPWVPLALAASLLLTTGSAVGYLHRHRRADGERAKAQVLAALRVTTVELRDITDRLAEHAAEDRDQR